MWIIFIFNVDFLIFNASYKNLYLNVATVEKNYILHKIIIIKIK